MHEGLEQLRFGFFEGQPGQGHAAHVRHGRASSIRSRRTMFALALPMLIRGYEELKARRVEEFRAAVAACGVERDRRR